MSPAAGRPSTLLGIGNHSGVGPRGDAAQRAGPGRDRYEDTLGRLGHPAGHQAVGRGQHGMPERLADERERDLVEHHPHGRGPPAAGGDPGGERQVQALPPERVRDVLDQDAAGPRRGGEGAVEGGQPARAEVVRQAADLDARVGGVGAGRRAGHK